MKSEPRVMLMLLLKIIGATGRQAIKDHLFYLRSEHPDMPEPRDLLQFINEVEAGLDQIRRGE